MTTKNTIHNVGVATHIGQYSDAIESGPGRMLFTSGTPGLTANGSLPESFEEQADQAWQNIIAILRQANMGPEHIVRVAQYLIRAEDLPRYKPIRAKYLGDNRPAFMLSLVSGLIWPNVLIEIEVTAVAPNS
jgi:2-iminobutanoate/2-iminopropanoate deaminase